MCEACKKKALSRRNEEENLLKIVVALVLCCIVCQELYVNASKKKREETRCIIKKKVFDIKISRMWNWGSLVFVESECRKFFKNSWINSFLGLEYTAKWHEINYFWKHSLPFPWKSHSAQIKFIISWILKSLWQ